MEFFDEIFSSDFQLNCTWVPANHFFFQMANIFLVLTYFVNPTSQFGLLQLRFALMMAGFCFGFWGAFILCSLDTMIWNLAFAFGNGVHLVYLIIRIRPMKFDHEHETMYASIFKPVGIRRYQYKELLKLAERRVFMETEPYAETGIAVSNHIGILLEGSFEVRLKDMILSHIDPLEFMDSPEWIGVDEYHSTTYQVSLIAQQPSIVYVWSRQNILKTFKNDNVIKNVFDSLVGKDICKKLFSVHKKLLLNESEKTSPILYQAPLVTYSTANLLEMCHTPNNNQDKSKNDAPKISIPSPQHSVDLSKHLNFQSVEVPIQSKTPAANHVLFRQSKFSADNDESFEDAEKQKLILRETDL